MLTFPLCSGAAKVFFDVAPAMNLSKGRVGSLCSFGTMYTYGRTLTVLSPKEEFPPNAGGEKKRLCRFIPPSSREFFSSFFSPPVD